MAAKGNKVFISYRREDAADAAGRMRDWLMKTLHITKDDIFMDVDTILPGADFLQVIEKYIDQCRAMVVVISPSWIRQVNSPDTSYVRLEVESALRHSISVVPVLVGLAQMPKAEELPPSLHPLLRHNAQQVRSDSFEFDMDRVRRMRVTHAPRRRLDLTLHKGAGATRALTCFGRCSLFGYRRQCPALLDHHTSLPAGWRPLAARSIGPTLS